MLFDIEDYCLCGYMGTGANPAWEVFDMECPGYNFCDLTDVATTFRATSDAFARSLEEYIGVAGAVLGDDAYGVTNLPCNNAVCSPGPIVDTGLEPPNNFTPAGFNNFANLYVDHRAKVTALLDHLILIQGDPTIQFNQAFYDDMITAFNLMMCGFKDLMKILDDDDFINYF